VKNTSAIFPSEQSTETLGLMAQSVHVGAISLSWCTSP